MYSAIEGVIGVGKTTLARMLQPRFEAELQMEVFEENPFLADFYTDRARYAFQTQIFFLLSRYHQQKQAVRETVGNGHNLLTDYTFAKDGLFARINLEGDELAMYERVHAALGEKVTVPDLVVYLKADTDVLMQRMVASACHTGDVVVIISWTGRTRELVDIARLARESGAVVLGITAPASPLAMECTETLEVATPEDTDVYMPMTSRMIQLTLIDVLATGVTLRRCEDFLPHLKKIKDSLLETRYPATRQD